MSTDGPIHNPIRIPARNRRQTMDWALVLASQGIEAVIEHDAEGSGWGLVVATADHEAALRFIRLYRLENRHWHWRQPLAGLIFDGRVFLWVLLVVTCYFLRPTADLQVAGRMDNAAVRAGEWWRIFTAMLLHANIAHLAANVTIGIVLLGLTMGRYGAGVGLLLAYLAGAGGNIAGLWLYPASHLGLGASGMVMGGLGMLAAQTVSSHHRNPIARSRMWKGVIAGGLLFVLFGLSPEANVDVVAHIGGFTTGFLLGAIWVRMPARWHGSRADIVAGILFAGLVGVTCWLAYK